VEERLGIAGAGAIACGLAATAAQHGEVVLWARSDGSAERAKTVTWPRVAATAARPHAMAPDPAIARRSDDTTLSSLIDSPVNS
jgi:ketopantoate reductase